MSQPLKPLTSLLERPAVPTLLEALARFLEEELRPQVAADRGLAYRCLVAASLCRSLGAEAAPAASEQADVLAWEAGQLAAGELDGRPGGPAWRATRERLAARLRLINPRFDLREDLP